MSSLRFSRDTIFWTFFGLIFLLPLIHKTTGKALYPGFELLLLMTVPLTLSSFILAIKRSAFLQTAMLVFALFVLVSLLSTALGRSKPLPAVYQFATNFKVVSIIAVGFLLAWHPETEARFWLLLKWLWVPLALLVLWQWLYPLSYNALLQNQLKDYFIPKERQFVAYGPFAHPSFLALSAAIFMLCTFTKWILERDFSYCIPTLAYFVILLTTRQRAELGGALFTMLVLYFSMRGLRGLPVATLVILITAPVLIWLFWSLYGESLIKASYDWGLAESYQNITQPRPLIYKYGLRLAADYFPLGSGLGTFGGAGASRFDVSYYVEFGFYQYSWFLRKNVLDDTYWPNFIAETGWLGACLLAIFYILLGGYAGLQVIRNYPTALRLYWSIAFGNILFLFLLAFTSPSFQDPALSFLPMVFWGIAFNHTLQFSRSRKAQYSYLRSQGYVIQNPI